MMDMPGKCPPDCTLCEIDKKVEIHVLGCAECVPGIGIGCVLYDALVDEWDAEHTRLWPDEDE